MAAAGGLVLLAAVETAQALIAPTRAATDSDWEVAASQVRVGFQSGDLIVAAPRWADPLMRMHLGDLLEIPVAARMDDARYGRIWELAQGGARAPETAGGPVVFEQRFGALVLRRVERKPAEVTFDFLERWQEAYVTRWDPVRKQSSTCSWQADRFVCPISANQVRRALVEVDTSIRRAILAPAVTGAIVAIEFPSVRLGKQLVVAAGLHDVWARKSPGSVYFEVWIAGQRVADMTVDSLSSWSPLSIDTVGQDGQSVPVRFQISSARADLRLLAFAAEARR